jgi:hypothetical protein
VAQAAHRAGEDVTVCGDETRRDEAAADINHPGGYHVRRRITRANRRNAAVVCDGEVARERLGPTGDDFDDEAVFQQQRGGGVGGADEERSQHQDGYN